MHDLRYVVENLDVVRQRLAKRSQADADALAPIADWAAKRRELIQKTEAKAAERNAANQGMAKADKKSDEFAKMRDSLKALSAEIKELEAELGTLERKIEEVLVRLPNLPSETTPVGTSEADNQVVRSWGEKPTLDFAPKAHWDIGTGLGILDFERAAKLSGARFAVLTGLGAKLERALIHLMLEMHTEQHGYREVLPPLLVKDTAMFGTGQLPKFEEDLFKTRKADPDKPYDLYLIPTAEVPVTNLHAEEILDEADLPVRYTAFTPCFRAEAGSHGKDVRGLIRQHQFNKVELVRYETPETSEQALEELTGHAEKILQKLGLHYRVVNLCTADLGFSSQRTYDLEVWLPEAGAYREISSCSNFGDFQARRAKIRYRPNVEKGKAKPRFVHTLNGSGLAVGRTLIAVLEQYQQADGSVVVPEALRAFMGCDRITPKA